MCYAYHAMPAWSTCPDTHVLRCQKRTNFSFLRANVSINLPPPNTPQTCQFFNLAANVLKGMETFQLLSKIFQFLNFSVMLNICKFQEILENSRKFTLRNKEYKFWHHVSSLRNYFRNCSTRKYSHKKQKES